MSLSSKESGAIIEHRVWPWQRPRVDQNLHGVLLLRSDVVVVPLEVAAGVDAQLHAGDVAGLVRRQPQHRVADVLGLDVVAPSWPAGRRRPARRPPGSGSPGPGRNDLYIGSLCSMSVLQLVGCTTLARMPRGASSVARSWTYCDSSRLRVHVGHAARVAAGVVASCGRPSGRRWSRWRRSTRPPCRCGSATWMALMVPIRLVLMTSIQACSGGSPFMPAMPAWATTMSTLPNSAMPALQRLTQLAGLAHVGLRGDDAAAGLLDELGGLLEILGRRHRVADGRRSPRRGRRR